jgi:hypothetical protein
MMHEAMDDFVAQRPQPLAISQLGFAFAFHQFISLEKNLLHMHVPPA